MDDTHAPRGYPARSFTSFAHAAAEAAQSRLYGGIHYPMAIAAGLDQGASRRPRPGPIPHPQDPLTSPHHPGIVRPRGLDLFVRKGQP